MATTYEAIATVTVGSGGAANIEFTSIPATYTDILAVFSVRSDSGNVDTELQFNSSTSNLSSRWLVGSGSGVSSASFGTSIQMGGSTKSTWTSNTFGNVSVYVTNYASSNNKSISIDSVSENNATEAYATLTAGLWSNSAAITSLKIKAGSGNFVQYSTATLYGIKNS